MERYLLLYSSSFHVFCATRQGVIHLVFSTKKPGRVSRRPRMVYHGPHVRWGRRTAFPSCIHSISTNLLRLDLSKLRSLRICHATPSGEAITRDISSTNWSAATSLTHLSYCGYPISLQTFLDCFKELSLHYRYVGGDVQSVVTKPHHTLSVIKFSSVYYHVNLSKHVADLLSVAQSKMLPSLTCVLITRGRTAKDDGGLPWGKFRTLGITLNF
jgi:hypothetical protein